MNSEIRPKRSKNSKTSSKKIKQDALKTDEITNIPSDDKENQLSSPYFKKETNEIKSVLNSAGLKLISQNNNQMNLIKTEPQDIVACIKTEPSCSSELNEEPTSKKVKWEPSSWRESLELIKKMRSQQNAPVDTMGCDSLSSLNPNILPKTKRYHVLVSLMLSAQTKDEVTAKAFSELEKLPLDIDTILSTDEETIAKAIYPASFFRRKAQYIKRTSQILKDQYDYDIPKNVQELCKLPGVGPKMAYICMSSAWNETVGIGVDTHVHRISNRLGWTKTQTKSPEQTRKELEDWLPQCHWNEVNHLLVGFGQQTCRPVGPKCSDCLCNQICPTGQENLKIPKKSRSKVKVEIKLENE